jgi:hypothetical protein
MLDKRGAYKVLVGKSEEMRPFQDVDIGGRIT